MEAEERTSGPAAADQALAELYHASYRRLVTQMCAFTTDLTEATPGGWVALDLLHNGWAAVSHDGETWQKINVR